LAKKAPQILIVDDDNLNLTLLCKVISNTRPEYQIKTVSNGEDALSFLQNAIPDIIMLDVMMPGISGFEVCERVKKDARLKNIPILLITGLDRTEEKIKGFQLGAADYITKPFNSSEAIARIEAHLRIKQYHDELKEINEKLTLAQSALVESAKMSAVGSLAAGVSHEFNNMLTMMAGHAKLALKSDDIKDLHETIAIIQELVERGKDIVKSLLSFSKGDKESQGMTEADIKEIIAKVFLLMKKMIEDAHVEVKGNFNQVPRIKCYPNQLSQVFINLFKNAIEAMPKSAKKILTVSVEEKALSSCSGFVKDRIPSGSKTIVLIKVSDTGSGIPEEVKEKIFEPFVTTKSVLYGGNETTPGTGLGLSISYGIIKRHNGCIAVNSVINEGTTFEIALPVN